MMKNVFAQTKRRLVKTGCHHSHNINVWPFGSNIPYSNSMVKGAGDKMIADGVKTQREDLCGVALEDTRERTSLPAD